MQRIEETEVVYQRLRTFANKGTVKMLNCHPN